MPVAVVFDLDGTLIDSAPDLQAAVAVMLAGEGREPLDLATVISFIGDGLPKLVERVVERLGIDPAELPRLQQVVFQAYSAAPTVLTRPYAGVEAALQAMATAGHKMALCTNKPEAPTRAILRDLGLERYFPVVIGGDSLAQRKPHPAPLQAALAGLGVARALYIGDSEIDAATALAADLPFVLFTRGYRKQPIEQLPHLLAFEDFAQLPTLVAEFSAELR